MEGKTENSTFQILVANFISCVEITPFWGGTMKAERGPYWLQNEVEGLTPLLHEAFAGPTLFKHTLSTSFDLQCYSSTVLKS